MEIIETHAHIYSDQFKEDLDTVIARAQAEGVTKIYMPNIDADSIEDMLFVEEKYPELCISMMGLHPCSVKANYKDQLQIIESWLDKRPFAAVGEIGTDLFWDKTFWKEQQDAFIAQCKMAIDHNLPVVIHCRESIDETLDLLTEMTRLPRGIFHCFTGSIVQARRITDLGFLMGIGGVATFKKGGLEPVLKEIDIKHLVVETDSPYLAPTPNRGKRNEPAYIKHVIQKIADCKELSSDEVSYQTTQNALAILTKA